jgi:hypothetical protein
MEYTAFEVGDLAKIGESDKRLSFLRGDGTSKSSVCLSTFYGVVTSGGGGVGRDGECEYVSRSRREHAVDITKGEYYVGFKGTYQAETYAQRHYWLRPMFEFDGKGGVSSKKKTIGERFLNLIGKGRTAGDNATNSTASTDAGTGAHPAVNFPTNPVSKEKNAELSRRFAEVANGKGGKDALVVMGVTYAVDGNTSDGRPAEKHNIEVVDPIDGKKYVRIVVNSLSADFNGIKVKEGEEYFVSVEPVEFLYDETASKGMSKYGLVGNIRMARNKNGNNRKFENTNMSDFLNSRGEWEGIGFSEQIKPEREPMTTRRIPNGPTEITANAFNGCFFLRELRIPNSVYHYGKNCFAGTKFEYIQKTKNDDIILSVEPSTAPDIVETRSISKYANVFTGLDIVKFLCAHDVTHLDKLVEWCERERVKLPFGFVCSLVNGAGNGELADKFAQNATFKGAKGILKQIPSDLGTEDLVDFYTLAYDIGCFSKNAKLCLKANTWLDERIKVREKRSRDDNCETVGANHVCDLPFNKMHTHFDSLTPKGECEEFSEFLFSKNSATKISNFNELVNTNNSWGTTLSGIYREFANPYSALGDGGRFRDKDGKLMFRVMRFSQNEQGHDTSKPHDLKPTVELFVEYFSAKRYTGVETVEDKAIVDEFKKHSGLGQEEFDDAKGIMAEYHAKNIPTNIVGKHLCDLTKEIVDYRKQTEKLAGAGVEAAKAGLDKFGDIAAKRFTYDWLEKNDPQNFVLGLYCDCCANIRGAGYGIMRSNFVHPDVQNLVVRDGAGVIVAKSTVFVNRVDGYAVFNNVEVTDGVYKPSDKSEVFDAFMEGANAFYDEYNRQNPKSPLKHITVGAHLNDLERQFNEKTKRSKATLCSLNFGEYGKDHRNYNGDWDGAQYDIIDKE